MKPVRHENHDIVQVQQLFQREAKPKIDAETEESLHLLHHPSIYTSEGDTQVVML